MDLEVYWSDPDLRYKNHRNSLMIRLFTNNHQTGIEDYAERMAECLRYIHQKHNKTIVIIGFSMGGLVARYCKIQ